LSHHVVIEKPDKFVPNLLSFKTSVNVPETLNIHTNLAIFIRFRSISRFDYDISDLNRVFDNTIKKKMWSISTCCCAADSF